LRIRFLRIDLWQPFSEALYEMNENERLQDYSKILIISPLLPDEGMQATLFILIEGRLYCMSCQAEQ
jgi:hypothetical protein